MSESKRREVLQLLRDYRAFMTPFGSAMPADESHLRSARFGAAGYTESGAEFAKADRARLRHSYKALDAALRILKRDRFGEWLGLHGPYLMDGADPGLPGEWRRRLDALDAENKRRRAAGKAGRVALVTTRRQLQRHDLALDTLADMLRRVDLHVVFPKRSNSRDAESVERRNDELYKCYRRLRSEMTKTRAVREAARLCDYSEDRVWKIVVLRSA